MPAKTKSRRTKKAKASAAKRFAVFVSHKLVKGTRGGRQLAIRKSLGFNRSLFARVLVTSERNLASIESGKRAGLAVNRSINELERLVAALSEVVEPNVIGEWMKTPNDAFAGLKPLEVIERGESDRIWQMIYEMRSGVPV